jgi:hypothetical protein
MNVFSKKGGSRSSAARKKKSGSPLPASYGGCGGDEDKKHIFQMYGKPLECCQRCGMQHESIVKWRTLQVETGNAGQHPYVAAGIWSGREYVLAMKR